MEAFEWIYNETKEFVFKIIYKMVHIPQEAEDLMQDTFIKLYEKRRTFKNQSSIKTWIYRMAVNNTLNHLKKKKRFNEGILQYRPEQEEVDTNDNEAKTRIVQNLLSKINPSYKICLLLKENEKMSYADIAKTLDINIGTVRSRINRAKKELVKLYKKEVSSNE
ncbi:MAG: hypothetical protein A2Y40_02210 [Candidatus Margulisbacteria bacterium GWF2_35_9]|nr:MAG: hypothetical protein A2Y40_02210 [Candidatus Margulisbacteria bacterium GWF2_35_9]